MGKRKVCARFVSHFLPEDQKVQCIAASKDWIEMDESDEDFLDLIVTDDKSWCENDPSTKHQSSVWLSPKAKKPQKSMKYEIKNQDNAHCFLRSKRYYALRNCSWMQDGGWWVLRKSYEAFNSPDSSRETTDVYTIT